MTTKKVKLPKPHPIQTKPTGPFFLDLQVEADGSYWHRFTTNLLSGCRADMTLDQIVESLERHSVGLYKILFKPGLRVLAAQVTPKIKPHGRRMFAMSDLKRCECKKSCLLYIQTTDSKNRLRDSSFDIALMWDNG